MPPPLNEGPRQPVGHRIEGAKLPLPRTDRRAPPMGAASSRQAERLPLARELPPRDLPPLREGWISARGVESAPSSGHGRGSIRDGPYAQRVAHPKAGAGRGSLAMARAVIGDAARSEAAARSFRQGALAESTRPVYDSYLRTLESLALAGGFELLPLSQDKLDRLGGALRAAGYRSIKNYLERYRRLHVVEGGAWSAALAYMFRGALRSAIRGLGPPKRAARIATAELCARGDCTQDGIEEGPRHVGAFTIVGVWWLLREVECSALSLSSVQEAAGSDAISLLLGATKTDIQGRGVVRAHRCICSTRTAWKTICPACTLRRQLQRRRQAGAESEAPLFPAAGSDMWTVKRAVVQALRGTYAAEESGVVDGHSMRRTGAQLLTASGVEPWYVEWFGRWGSSAIRAYIEDARAWAPEASRLALVAAESSKPEAQDVQVEVTRAVELKELRSEVAELSSLVRLAVRGSEAEPMGDVAAPDALVTVDKFGGKSHLAFAISVEGARAGRVALCGWSFGGVSARTLNIAKFEPDDCEQICLRCARSAHRLRAAGPAQGGDADGGGEPEDESEDDSGSSEASEGSDEM